MSSLLACKRLLPTVGTHKRPLSSDVLHPTFPKEEDAALFLLLTSWEKAYHTGANPSLVESHYEDVYKGASAACHAEVTALLKQVVRGLPGSMSAGVPLSQIRAAMALRVLTTTGDDVHQDLELLRGRLSVLVTEDCRHSARAATTFTLLLLTEYRTTKALAAQKWISMMDEAIINQQKARALPTPIAELCTVSLTASVALCVPGLMENTVYWNDNDVADELPQLSPSFVALFWCSVIGQLSEREADPSSRKAPEMLSVRHIVCALVDLFGVMMRLAIAPDYVDVSPGTLIQVCGPQEERLAPHTSDAYFAIFMPTVLQQLGFEWPWSSWMRASRSLVNRARQDGKRDDNMVSRCADQLWTDVIDCLAPRCYLQRLLQALPPSLHLFAEAACIVREKATAFRELDQQRVPAELIDIHTLALETCSKLTSSGQNAKEVLRVSKYAIDALPHVLQLRRERSQGNVQDAHMTVMLWILLLQTNWLKVRSHVQDSFLTLWAEPFEDIRRHSDWGTLDTARVNPFVQVCTYWTAAMFSNDRQQEATHRVATEMLRFMTSCYLPVQRASGATRTTTRIGMGVTATDIIAVFHYATTGDDAGGSRWRSAGASIRELMRSVTQRLSYLKRVCTSEATDAVAQLDGADRQLLELESDRWSAFLASFPDSQHDGVGWVAPVGVLHGGVLA